MARLGIQTELPEDSSQKHADRLQAERIHLIDSLEGNPGSYPFVENFNKTQPEALRILFAQINNAISELQKLMEVDRRIVGMRDLNQRASQDGSGTYSTWLELLEEKRATILSILEGDQ